jgi:rare lipoprotein A
MFLHFAALAGVLLFGVHAVVAEELPRFDEAAPGPHYSAVGMASWYGSELQGHRTADGEVFDMRSVSAAHRTMPIPSYARVTNLINGHSMVVRVNDRGPFVGGRILDVSARVANLLEFNHSGITKVRIDYLGKAPPAGSDGPALLASLQTAGRPMVAVVAPAFGSHAPALLAIQQNAAPSAAAGPVPAAETHSPLQLANLQTANAYAPIGSGPPVGAPVPVVFAGIRKAGASGAGGSVMPAGSHAPAPLESPRKAGSSSATGVSTPASARSTSDEGVSVVARVDELRLTSEEHSSPYGDLISSPFLVQASRP